MNFLICGCGSIGKRHANSIKNLGNHKIFCFDRDVSRMQEVIRETGAEAYDLRAKHIKIDAFIICTPPEFHVAFMKEALEHNSHIFVEKPISNSMIEIRNVLQQADKMDRVVMTGYQLRFDPALQRLWMEIARGELGKIVAINAEFGYALPLWHPSEDYHNLYTTHTGIVLDASHEIDYVMWLAGSKISRIRSVVGTVSGLDMAPGAEDIANILISFENGVFGNIHLNCISQRYTRKCEVVGTEATRTWDILKESVDDANVNHYYEEMKWFIGCVQGILEPKVNGWAGLDVMSAALIAKNSSGMENL